VPPNELQPRKGDVSIALRRRLGKRRSSLARSADPRVGWNLDN
jgi:hypothetical protein